MVWLVAIFRTTTDLWSVFPPLETLGCTPALVTSMSTLEIQTPKLLKCSFFLPMDLWELVGQAVFILLVISLLNAASFALNEPQRFCIDDCLVVNGREHSPGCIHFSVHWWDSRNWEWALKTQVSFIKEKWAYHWLFWVKYSAEWEQQRHVALPGAWSPGSIAPRAGTHRGSLSCTSGARAGLAGRVPALAGSSHKGPLSQRKWVFSSFCVEVWI